MVGLNKGVMFVVFDVIVGFGCDGFVLVLFGCKVILYECYFVVVVLLFDGLECVYNDVEIGLWMKENMSLVFGFSYILLV